MLRAVLVSTSTAIGLVAVFSYSGGDDLPAGLALQADVAGLGAPPSDEVPTSTGGPVPSASEPGPETTSTSPAPSSRPASSAPAAPTDSPSTSTSSTSPGATRSAAPRPSATPSRATSTPKPSSSSPRPTPTATATPTPTTSTPPPAPTYTDYLGPVVSHRHGDVQVGIRVQDGRITKAWAAVYPTGEAQPYTNLAVPKLSRATLLAQSADIATVSGATLTSDAWTESLQGALTKAGI